MYTTYTKKWITCMTHKHILSLSLLLLIFFTFILPQVSFLKGYHYLKSTILKESVFVKVIVF